MTDQTATLYHNPRCSKSRAALKVLQDSGIEPTIIEYLKAPPTPADLRRLLTLLDKIPPDVIRFKEARAKELELKINDVRSDDEWLRLIHDNPVLLERPILVMDNQAIIGRPTEAIESFLASRAS